MGLFSKLFGSGKKEQPQRSNPNDTINLLKLISACVSEMTSSIPKYLQNRAIDLKTSPIAVAYLDATQKDQSLLARLATEKNLFRRRMIAYDVLDRIHQTPLTDLQIIHRFLERREPHKALAHIEMVKEHSGNQTADFCSAVAQTYLVLSDYVQAQEWIGKGLLIDEKHRPCRIIQAELHYLDGLQQEAMLQFREIFNEVPDAINSLQKDTVFTLSYRSGILYSPAFAYTCISSSKSLDLWDAVASEYLHSPFFAIRHAMVKLKLAATQEHITQLIELSRTMEWSDEVVFNAYSNLLKWNDFKKTESFPEDLVRLKYIVNTRGISLDNFTGYPF